MSTNNNNQNNQNNNNNNHQHIIMILIIINVIQTHWEEIQRSRYQVASLHSPRDYSDDLDDYIDQTGGGFIE
ncbi:hypothetical protein DFA_09251 [Cavenderia fasciculata]|uniref:Uncharacterized protein n=1 Tax=Cavenderia fasciculata TaxID=261658 RepID=F4Q739_CACFS|nr:uncharacterized protein DFA_09251 [Cavenderia fasciculata]EGG16221.1 hypothetical protein DFA_09251 [Cavenderia fasciculata]|eukprot:XP_004354605.1 hypothetical protein DFA_09251 [Cavenderia fasciculata]